MTQLLLLDWRIRPVGQVRRARVVTAAVAAAAGAAVVSVERANERTRAVVTMMTGKVKRCAAPRRHRASMRPCPTWADMLCIPCVHESVHVCEKCGELFACMAGTKRRCAKCVDAVWHSGGGPTCSCSLGLPGIQMDDVAAHMQLCERITIE